MKPCASTRTAASCGASHGLPGPHCRYRRRLRGQHQLVHILLRRTEFPVDRKRARDVGSVAVQFATGIYQQQIAWRFSRALFST